MFPTRGFPVASRCIYVYLPTPPQATILLPSWKPNLHVQILYYVSFHTSLTVGLYSL